MSLSIISQENKIAEQQIQNEIFTAIDENENIIFSSGAGAGKTYALIESLKYIITKHGERLKDNNQKIICITYTNVASEEVNERLGNSNLVKVSTIHERIWELIKNYQNELVEIHKEKLKSEINLLNKKLIEDAKFIKYQDLSDEGKISFTDLMISKKELFYNSLNEKSKEFGEIFNNDLKPYPNILKNYTNFKSLVNTIYKIKNYSSCLESIKSKKKGFNKVVYNAMYNIDRLHWMRISHETLLEYGLKIIKNHKLLQQIIIDKYPYFLIDEYQDTNEQVIEIMTFLSKCSLEIEHPLFIGYFGDSAQNIYDQGIGKNLLGIHNNLKAINKPFNRRSYKEVIDIINNIRNDEIKQEPIYENSEGGSVKFYSGNKENINDFLATYYKDWNITIENKLHCFVLTNESVAKYSGFYNIYSFFKNTKKYKANYKQLTTEVLSDDISKLGEIPTLIFRIIDFKNKLLNKKTPIVNILKYNIYEDMNIQALKSFIDTLKKCKGNTIKELEDSIHKIYKEEALDIKYKQFIDELFNYEGFPSKSLMNYIKEVLYANAKDEEINEIEKSINEFLDLSLEEFDLWYKYILREENKNIIYHTYHGTKGLEFNNVIILMENAFGKNRNYFNNFFSELSKNDELPEEFEKQKNLMYVSCSRAIKNLRVLYLDDISSFKKGIEKIFVKVERYE
ncbi:UvrD-helicase domain-containing protein [Tenacibaculum halocynthiae]|uniref:UvrD-helicase domain-containing protein n=1 Tax=Tenacibaculum halocynthiae TaxID=1254437 RepID=UPI003D64773C